MTSTLSALAFFCIKLLEPVLMDRCDTNLANNESGFNDNSSNIYTSSIKNHEDKNLGINFNALQSSIYPKSNFLCITFFFSIVMSFTQTVIQSNTRS